MNVAFVGCGMIADAHVQEVRKIDGTHILAVCDSEILMAEQLAERYGIPKTYSSIDDMLTENSVDVVHILSPPSTHYELASKALDHGCHVLVEKPFVVYASEASSLIERAKSLNMRITVNHFHSFSPPQIELKKRIREGQLGNISHVECHYGYRMEGAIAQSLLHDSNSWIYALPGNIIQNNISHIIGTVLEIFPDEIFKVFAVSYPLGEEVRRKFENKVFDELRVMMIGSHTSIFVTFSCNINPSQHFMKIYGSKNTLTVDFLSRSVVLSPCLKVPGAIGKLIFPFQYSWNYLEQGVKNVVKFVKNEFHFYAGTNTLLNKFYASIENGGDVPIPYDEIIKATRIIEEIFEKINLSQRSCFSSNVEDNTLN